MSNTNTRRPYLLEIDVMRIILILGVLLTHTQSTMSNATDVNSVSRAVFSYTHLMLHFTRMGFVFITGLVLMWRYYQRPFNWFLFWKRRYVRIGIPYIFWISIYLIGIMLIKQQSLSSFWPQWLDTIMHGSQFYMYYLFMIAQLYLVFPIFRWLFEQFEQQHQLILLLSLVLQLLLVATIKYGHPTNGEHPLLGVIFWHYGTDPLMYQLYFVLGAYSAVHYQSVTRLIDQFGRQLSAIAVGLSVMSIGLYWFDLQILHLNHHQAESIHQPFMVIMDVAMILMVWYVGRCYVDWQADKKHNLGLHYSGQLVFGIYLMQTIMLTILAGMLRLINWPSWVYLFLTPITFCSVFGGTYLLVAMVSRSTILRPLVGLKLTNDEGKLKSY